jgi:hypothetical protein
VTASIFSWAQAHKAKLEAEGKVVKLSLSRIGMIENVLSKLRFADMSGKVLDTVGWDGNTDNLPSNAAFVVINTKVGTYSEHMTLLPLPVFLEQPLSIQVYPSQAHADHKVTLDKPPYDSDYGDDEDGDVD